MGFLRPKVPKSTPITVDDTEQKDDEEKAKLRNRLNLIQTGPRGVLTPPNTAGGGGRGRLLSA